VLGADDEQAKTSESSLAEQLRWLLNQGVSDGGAQQGLEEEVHATRFTSLLWTREEQRAVPKINGAPSPVGEDLQGRTPLVTQADQSRGRNKERSGVGDAAAHREREGASGGGVTEGKGLGLGLQGLGDIIGRTATGEPSHRYME
jgi:hypothetical protein